MWKGYVGILCITLVSASCPKHCPCLCGDLTCTSGLCTNVDVSCGCCGVCPRQLFEDCSETQPCDHTKGLECNFGGRNESAMGICRAKSDGRSCEYNNRIHQNGEIFRPNCKHQCTCMDGAVGCVPLCSRELLLPRPGCFKTKRVKVARRCCEQLVCTDQKRPQFSAEKKNRKKKSNDRASVGEKELMTAWRGRAEPSAAIRNHPIDNVVASGQKCPSVSTACSRCSKFCVAGISSRLIISETHCTPIKETWVCAVRPCNHQIIDGTKKGQSCCPSQDASRPVKLSYAGCRSLRKFQPGSCGRCCRAPRTHTAPVLFRCRNKKVFSRMMTFTESCECALNSFSNNKDLNVLHAL
ncbi:protein CYR61-like [Cynoglossus semilaevis]|uniref:Protein CYR61-like n=1 Tax=Cynoglossus semilaevis TaxID=244447 RepID=A0A3P8VWW1_CYNSE|nr:protein CYR61-like [Cynoglossus semilaevis]